MAALGVATGGTCGGVILHSSVESMDAIEISPLALNFEREHFAEFNRGAFADPRVRPIVEDARWILNNRKQSYDVVIGDLFMPWKTGVGRLYTREHFESVRQSLKPGGLFCQWLPMYQLTRRQFETVLNTFGAVFGNPMIVRGDFYSELAIIGLIGGKSPEEIDWSRVAEGCQRLRRAGECFDPLARHVEGVAMTIVGVAEFDAGGPVNTLANMRVELDAGSNILGMKEAWFIGVPLGEFLRDVQRANSGRLPSDLRGPHESGQFFYTLDLAKRINSRHLTHLTRQMKDRVPTALREDAEADWARWPMAVRPFP